MGVEDGKSNEGKRKKRWGLNEGEGEGKWRVG